MQREPGYYYVLTDFGWIIAEHDGGVRYPWQVTGSTTCDPDSAFQEIGPRVPTREEWQAAERDHAAMEVLRGMKALGVLLSTASVKDTDCDAEIVVRRGDKDPADAILSAAGERKESKP